MATHHPYLDFTAIYSGYTDGWSLAAIHALRESLMPHAQLVAEQVSAQWVMDARRANAAKGEHQEDVAQIADSVEPRSEANVTPPLSVPSVVQPESEQPLLSPVAPSTDVAGQP